MYLHFLVISKKIAFKYRYKNSLSKNLLYLGDFNDFNFVPLKITSKDTSIILNLNCNNDLSKMNNSY